ncbi:MAG: SDR family NAD(P)-dependent oxidoreductase [bacterium]|nr:SDR family NAD(P)-dependent oxidoreductase [bacterium]
MNVFITGANGGLGLETCKHLLGDGVERLVLACRSEEKASGAKRELSPSATKTELCTASGFDMNDPDAIRAGVAELGASSPFDVVFLQSGGVTYGNAWKTIEYGGRQIERTIFQNVLGAHATLMALIDRGLVAPNARVVLAGGEGARGIPGLIENPSFASPLELRDYVTVADPSRRYHEMNAMGVSKFAGALWTLEAAERFGDSMEVIWFTPGLTAGTKGLNGVGKFKQWMFENVGFPMMVLLGKAQTAEQGARKYADCLQGKIGHNGDLIGAPEGTALGHLQDQKPMNPSLTDANLRREFWAIVEEVLGAAPSPADRSSARASATD